METSARLEAMARGDAQGDAKALMRLLDEQVAGLLNELKAVPLPGSMRVLIADDDRVMRHALGRKLSSWDFEPVPCSDGLKCAASCRKRRCRLSR